MLGGTPTREASSLRARCAGFVKARGCMSAVISRSSRQMMRQPEKGKKSASRSPLHRHEKGVPMMTNDALRTLLPIANWPEERAHVVEITGGTDPILPTPFRIGETSTAALAAIGL